MSAENSSSYASITENVIDRVSETFHMHDRPQTENHDMEWIPRDSTVQLIKLLSVSVAQLAANLAASEVDSKDATALNQRVSEFESALNGHRVSFTR